MVRASNLRERTLKDAIRKMGKTLWLAEREDKATSVTLDHGFGLSADQQTVDHLQIGNGRTESAANLING